MTLSWDEAMKPPGVYELHGEKEPTAICCEKTQSSFSNNEPQVLFTPVLFYRHVLQLLHSNIIDPYFLFLSHYKGERIFPAKIVLPRPFIESAPFPLTMEERITLYALPYSTAKEFFEMMVGGLFFSAQRRHVAHVAVISLPLKDPFLLAGAGPVDVDAAPTRDVSAFIVENDQGRYAFAPTAGNTAWVGTYSAEVSEGFRHIAQQVKSRLDVVDTVLEAVGLQMARDEEEKDAEQRAFALSMPASRQVQPNSLEEAEIRQLIAKYRAAFPGAVNVG